MRPSMQDRDHRNTIESTKKLNHEQGIQKQGSNRGADDDDTIEVLIQPMITTDRRTSRKFKDADPCYKFCRRAIANDTDLVDSDCSESDKSGGYVDYDPLPNRWRLSSEED